MRLNARIVIIRIERVIVLQRHMFRDDMLGDVGGDIPVQHRVFALRLHPDQRTPAAQAHAPGFDNLGLVLVALAGRNALFQCLECQPGPG